MAEVIVRPWLERREFVCGVFVLVALLFAATNLPWQLDDFDQAKQAFTSFEMVQQNHWIYQHTPNGWVATKPPLVGWISAGIFFATRSWEIAWRLPSILTGAILILMIWRAAFTAYGAVPAFVGVSAAGLNLFAPRLATLVRTDAPLALTIFLIGWITWEKIRRRVPWKGKDRIAIFLLLAAGMLMKGPIVYAFLLPGILFYEWQARKRREEFSSAWCGWWPWILSLGVFGLWTIGGILFVPEFTQHVVLREFLGRFNEVVHRAQPFYFYLPHLLHRFAPWSLLLLFFGILNWREGECRLAPETLWLLAWSFGGLLLMSFVPSKRVDRIFPIVPPLCLLLSAQVRNFRARGNLRRSVDRYCAGAIIFACLFSGGYSVGKIVSGYREHRDAFAIFSRAVREEANEHRWRYELVGGEDESMLLYLRKSSYLEPDEAAEKWDAGTLDGLVLPTDEWENLIPRLHGAVESKIGTSGAAGNLRKRYRFFVRPD